MRALLCCALTALLIGPVLSGSVEARHRHHHGHQRSVGFASNEISKRGKFGGPEGWSSYMGGGSTTAVDYPANIFSVKDETTDEKSEARFRTPDGRAKLTVYSLSNEDHDSPRSYIERHLLIHRKQLTYERVTDKFFAISGTRENLTFYSRCNFVPENGNMHCIYLEYPEREERAWDRIVTRISRSLNPPAIRAEGR